MKLELQETMHVAVEKQNVQVLIAIVSNPLLRVFDFTIIRNNF